MIESTNEKLRKHVETLFIDAPKTARAVELQEEMLQNLTDKYNDLIREGKSEEAAYNIAVASIGDVSDLVSSLHNAPAGQASKRGQSIFVAVAVALYILCVVPIILLQNELGVVLMFVLIAAATALLIINGANEQKYVRSDDTMVEEFKEWKQNTAKNRRACGAVVSSVWLLATCIYLLLSFRTGAWYITWLVFLIASGVCSVIKGIFELAE